MDLQSQILFLLTTVDLTATSTAFQASRGTEHSNVNVSFRELYRGTSYSENFLEHHVTAMRFYFCGRE